MPITLPKCPKKKKKKPNFAKYISSGKCRGVIYGMGHQVGTGLVRMPSSHHVDLI